MELSETQIKNQICDYLTARGIFYWVHQQVRLRSHRPAHLMKGIADIIGLLPDGRLLAIEVKSEKGKLSYEQEIFRLNVKKNKGLALVAHSVQQVDSFLQFYIPGVAVISEK